jgi:acyl carrier protein
MEETLHKIREGLLDLFPEIGDIVVTMDTRLNDIPDWDSITAVNLQTYLESTFHVKIPLDLLNDETTIGEIVTFIFKTHKGKRRESP